MSADDVYEKLRPCLQKVMTKLGTPMEEITREANLFHLGLDSLSAMDLIMEIENHFQVVLGDEDLQPELFENIANLVQVVSSKLTTANLPNTSAK